MWSRFRAPVGIPRRHKPTAAGDGACLIDSPWRLDWAASDAGGVRLFFPQPFAASYAYPLIVFLHDEAGSDADLNDWFPEVSGQNFLAAAVRAPFPHVHGHPGKFSWRGRPLASARQIVGRAVHAVSQYLLVHAERIYLMGVGAGAELALGLALGREESFAGAIAIDGRRLPQRDGVGAADASRRFLVARQSSPVDCVRLCEQLKQLGHETRCVSLQGAGSPSSIHVEINRWLMAAVPTTIW